MWPLKKKPVELKREWTSDGQGNVLTITVKVTTAEIAEWAKAVKFVPSYFKLTEVDKTRLDCVTFKFERPDKPEVRDPPYGESQETC